jgi:hypothetical protein
LRQEKIERADRLEPSGAAECALHEDLGVVDSTDDRTAESSLAGLEQPGQRVHRDDGAEKSAQPPAVQRLVELTALKHLQRIRHVEDENRTRPGRRRAVRTSQDHHPICGLQTLAMNKS